MSVYFNYFNCVKILLENGANHRAKDSQGNTIMHIAAKDNQIGTLEYFCSKSYIDHFARNDQGNIAF